MVPDTSDRFQTVQTVSRPSRRAVFWCDLILLPKNTNSGTRRRIEIFQKSKMIRIENPKLLAWFQTPQTVSRPSRPDFQPRKTNSGTRRPIEIFKKRKMIRIEFPKLLAWFQTPQTVSRPSRPSRPSSHTNFGTRRRIEIFKKRKMIRIEFPKVLAWFQTPQTVSRLSRPNFQPRKDPNSSGWNPSCFLCG